MASGDLVCADGEATAAGEGDSLSGGVGAVMGDSTASVGARGCCVFAGCPYTAGATATGLGCVSWLPITAGSTRGGNRLLGASALPLLFAAAATGVAVGASAVGAVGASTVGAIGASANCAWP